MTQEFHEFLQSLEDFIFSCKGDKTKHRFTDMQHKMELKRDQFKKKLKAAQCNLRWFTSWCYAKMGALYLRNEQAGSVAELCQKLQYSEYRYYPLFKQYYHLTPGAYQQIFRAAENPNARYVFHEGSWFEICRHCGGAKRL